MDDLTDTPQRLHDSEINASLSWFYDDGFKWELGDNINGWTTDGRASTARQANELAENAFAEFPARSPNGEGSEPSEGSSCAMPISSTDLDGARRDDHH